MYINHNFFEKKNFYYLIVHFFFFDLFILKEYRWNFAKSFKNAQHMFPVNVKMRDIRSWGEEKDITSSAAGSLKKKGR